MKKAQPQNNQLITFLRSPLSDIMLLSQMQSCTQFRLKTPQCFIPSTFFSIPQMMLCTNNKPDFKAAHFQIPRNSWGTVGVEEHDLSTKKIFFSLSFLGGKFSNNFIWKTS